MFSLLPPKSISPWTLCLKDFNYVFLKAGIAGGSSQIKGYKKYDTVAHGKLQLFKCNECENVFAETAGTPMQYLKSPISKVAGGLNDDTYWSR